MDGKGKAMDLESIDIESRTFEVVRKGYDRLQVDSFLTKVSGAMARIDERRTLAEVRCEQLEYELHDVRTRAETTIQETVAARAHLIEASARGRSDIESDPAPASPGQATIEAQRIVEQAEARAAGIHAEAEAVLEGALATSAKISTERMELLSSVDAERTGLIATAADEAESIRTTALQEAEGARAEAAQQAAAIRERAEADATLISNDAERRAAAVSAAAEKQRDELLERIERSRSDVDAAATLAIDGREIAPQDPPPWGHIGEERGLGDEADQMTVDLRESVPDDEPEPAVRVARPSRYRSRSARLPHLGEDAESIIESMESLRSKE
ncbi:MAG: DivIVA domain-containing protein [Actinomycetota bacterium]|nr:DivIVA domain-containing protein [Actinomycetota bacterium]